MGIFNQFSYILIALGILAVTFVGLRRYFSASWRITLPALGVVAVVFVVGFLLLRPGASTVDSVEGALEKIGNGRPTFFEFFSNYCTGCLVYNPAVNELVREIEDEYNIVQVDIHTDVGRALRTQLGFSFTPEFVLYDGAGAEVWRDHTPPTQVQLELARSPDVTSTE
jgi:thiol-disulfide isomerase/thioredoxin